MAKTPGIYPDGKDGKTWKIKISLGKDLVTGKYQDRAFAFHGTKKEAEQERTRLLRERDTGLLVADPSKWTVAEYLAHWLDTYVATNCRPKSESDYRGIVRRWIVPLLGDVKLAKLTTAHVRTLVATLLTAGRPGGDGRPLSARSVAYTHRVLSEALAHAVKWQMIGRNVADAVDPPRVQRKELEVWNADDARRFLDAVTATTDGGAEAVPYGTAMAFALQTGCRLGEVLGLRWTDADLDGGAVQIVQTIQRIYQHGLVFGQPKTGRSQRPIRLTPALVDLLRVHKARQNAARLLVGPAWQDNGLVFTTPIGTPVDPRNLVRLFDQAVAAAGLPRMHFHGLRHTHATLLLKQNVNPKIVSERLGHASVAITLDLYSHVLPDMQDVAVQALQGVFDQPRRRAAGHS